jgi:hypothetical protein
MKKIVFFLTLLTAYSLVSAQNFGNEWINYDQVYYKFSIAKEGMYRLNYQDLKNAGLPVDIINPKNIKLYAKGKEIAISIPGESDNKFDNTDYIEFYGTYNNGELDTDLYRIATEQPHTCHSLYQDSLPYYLTWQNGSQGKRWKKYNDLNYIGKTRDSFFTFESATYFRESWTDGNPFSGGLGQFSEYNTGEGWFSNAYSNGGYTYQILTPYFNTFGPSPFLKFSVYGKNDNVTLGTDGNNQEVSIYVGNTNALIFQKRFKGYEQITDAVSLSKNLISNSTPYTISSTISGGRMMNSFVKIEYPRNFDLGNTSSFRFSYSKANDYLEFDNYSKNNPNVYDIKNDYSISTSKISNKIKCNLPTGISNKDLLIYDSSDVVVLSSSLISTIQFKNYDFANKAYDFIILTHEKLDSSVAIYKDYRSSNEGGGHSVFIGQFPFLYDQYYYGIHHPLAIRNIVNEMISKQTTPPDHLFLIGKGQTYNRITLDYNNRILEDLVPTYGTPPSDYALTSMLRSNSLEPAVATGRIPARTNEQVINYLEKVKIHEKPTSEIWNKNVLHLAGGKDQSENNQFKNYLSSYNSTLSKALFGGKTTLLSKTDPLPTVGNLTTKAQSIINDGVAMVTYFGHGSAQVLEIEIGDAYQFKNEGKYPLFYFNGCALGNCFEQYSIPESFLFQPKVGCISWVASTSFGFASELHAYSNNFHQNIFKNNYGQSIGYNFKETIKNYQQLGNDYNRNNCRQLIYLGDPSNTLYSPDKPDYQFVLGSLKEFKVEGNILEKFATVGIQNVGKAILDTADITVKLTTSSGDTATLPLIRKTKFWNKDTLIFNLSKTGLNIGGIITLDIIIDPQNTIDELSPIGESNNRYSGVIFFAANGLRSVFPLKDQIVSKPEALLQVQTLNLYSNEQEIFFELDTTPLFNSPELKKSPLLKGANLIDYTFTLPPIDSTDYFWRARLNLPIDKGGEWVNNTFRYIYKSPNGWSQGYFDKFNESELNSIVLDNKEKSMNFGRTISGQYRVQTYGVLGSTDRNIVLDKANAVLNKHDWFNDYGLRFMAINPDDEFRFSINSKYNLDVTSKWFNVTGEYGQQYYEFGKKTGVYQFDTRNKEARDSMYLILKSIPDDYHLFLYSGWKMEVDSWENNLFNALAEFGLTKIQFNQNGHPYVGVGQKNKDLDNSVELLPDFINTTLAPEKQELTFSTKIYPKLSRGNIISRPIGPASKWTLFYLGLNGDKFDEVSSEIIGIDNNGNEYSLIGPTDDVSVDLSIIDASLYPKLKVKLYMQDDTNRTPAQLKHWTVLYDGLPEGTIVPVIGYDLNLDTIAENQPYQYQTSFKNISNYPLDSLNVLAYTKNNTTQKIDTLLNIKSKKLIANDTLLVAFSIPTLDKKGLNELIVEVNANGAVAEQSLANNTLIKAYYVSKDIKNPILDVTFDGSHIMNKDIVSPKPTITVIAKDDNKYLFLDDASQFELKLKSPGIDSFSQLNTGDLNFTFKPALQSEDKAELIYRPDKLNNGTYRLSVQVFDKNNNKSAETPYMIDFKVVNESTVTRVYPYPNPFTTSTKFVFTLTGERVPDVMNIQIFTVTGKMVKTISLNDLGNLKIGNNITDYAWDGTDEFGDLLANGVYMYKVTAKINGKTIEMNEDKNSDLFKNDIGKLYILR